MLFPHDLRALRTQERLARAQREDEEDLAPQALNHGSILTLLGIFRVELDLRGVRWSSGDWWRIEVVRDSEKTLCDSINCPFGDSLSLHWRLLWSPSRS